MLKTCVLKGEPFLGGGVLSEKKHLFHLSGGGKPLLFRLIEEEGSRIRVGMEQWWRLMELNCSSLRHLCWVQCRIYHLCPVDPGDFLPPKSEHYAIYGFLFPSHKIKPNFGSIHRESRTCQQSLAKTLNFAPWKFWTMTHEKCPLGWQKQNPFFFFTTYSENHDLSWEPSLSQIPFTFPIN